MGHQKLPDKSAAEAMKKAWGEHFDRLGEFLSQVSRQGSQPSCARPRRPEVHLRSGLGDCERRGPSEAAAQAIWARRMGPVTAL